MEADDNYPELRTKVLRSIAKIKERISKILYRGIKEGQVEPNVEVEEFGVFFYATIEGGIILSRAEGNTGSFQLITGVTHEFYQEC